MDIDIDFDVPEPSDADIWTFVSLTEKPDDSSTSIYSPVIISSEMFLTDISTVN
ncbi:hypothetical protein ASZ90_018944 [hydrocarbon metagenome]|uniref:Uncharacterized protein n=1 Tax=hydrocarbon metagenome TaxID=938273 RepID=A0A0W8E5M9_9ZZZZ